MSAGDHIAVLHVDEDPESARRTAEALEQEHERLVVETATSAGEGLDRLDGTDVDCVVAEYDLSGADGVALLKAVREDDPELPFVLFTDDGSESVASEAIAAGVTDYLRQDDGTERLADRIVDAVERRRADRTPDGTDDWLEELAETTSDVLWMFTHDWSELLFVNSAYEEIWGRSVAALHEDSRDFLEGVHPDDRSRVRAAMDRLSDGDKVDIEYRVNADEEYGRWVWVQGEPVFDESGEVVRVAGFARDVTDRKEGEQHLELMEQLVERMNDGAVIVQDGVIEYTNPRVSEIVGYDEADLVGRAMGEFIAPEYRDLVRERYRARVTGDGEQPPGLYEIAVVTESGERVPVEINVSRIQYKGRMATLSLVRDVTERKERERALETLQQRTQALMHTPSKRETGQVAVDTAHEVLDAPLCGFHLLADDGERLEPVAFVDTARADLDDPPTYDRTAESDPAAAVVWEAFESGEPLVVEDTREYGRLAEVTPARSAIVHPLADHGVFIVSATEPDAFDETDEALVDILATSLTTALDRAEREAELRRRNERLDAFASAVSHDLRNPLNVARGRMELVREDCDSGHLDDVEHALGRMDELIEDLLTLAQQGERVNEFETVALADTVEECWRTVAAAEATLGVETERAIRADRSQLRHLLENLLRNAVDHGGEDVTITVGTLEDGFYVADDGSGIPEDDREQVFERGYTTSADGTGFGLSIVEAIAEAHGWTVRVTDSSDGGARFEFTGVSFAQ